MSTTPDTSASTYILVEASHHGIVGMTEAVEGWPVQYVHASSNPTIRFSKYVKDYTTVNVVRGHGRLERAVTRHWATLYGHCPFTPTERMACRGLETGTPSPDNPSERNNHDRNR